MTWAKLRGPSLLDTVGTYPTEWWFVYSNMDNPRHPLARILKPGYQHVKALRRDGRVWILVEITFSFINVEVIRSDATPWQLFPGHPIDHVSTLRVCRNRWWPFHFLPITCVDICQFLIGSRAWWVKTPWQFHKHVRKHYGR